jgi:hypothetical protein
VEFCDSEAEFDDSKFDAESDAAEPASAKFDEVEFDAAGFGAAEFCAKEFCDSAEFKTAVSSCAARVSADKVEFFAEFRRDFSPLSARLTAAIFL